jgi:hypothetical protein
MLLKLKAIYSLTEQLYSGTLRGLVALGGNRKSPSQIKTVLDQLSTFPSQIEEQRLSAARAGAIVALGRAKAWQSELDSEEIATGCPEFKDDQSAFEEKDFNQCVWEMQPVACKLIEELNLNKYTLAYDDNNQKIKPPAHDVVSLIPPRRKHIFAPDIDHSIILNDEATFEALTGINCTMADLQMIDKEELAQDDPQPSRRQEDNWS